mgnify:CR=1 FL=1
MHQERGGIGRLDPRQEAIGQMLALARHRQEARGLVHHQHLVILMDHLKRVLRGIICIESLDHGPRHTGMPAAMPDRPKAEGIMLWNCRTLL